MAEINPKKAGDVVYPQYARITYEKVSAITITKGRLYTKGADAAGNQLIAVASGDSVMRGMYQAMESIGTAGTAGEHRVQCLGPGSRILIAAKAANMHAGDRVKYLTATHNVDVADITSGGVTGAEFQRMIGRIFEIYTKSKLNEKKDVTAAGDLVVVELGMA